MSTPNIDTKALRALEAEATPAPWRADCSSLHDADRFLARFTARPLEDAEFIAKLRNAAPALLDAAEERDRLKERLDQYEAAVRNPGDGERHRGASVAIQLVHAQYMREQAEAERDALKAEVEAERNEARGYREQFKTAVGHYTTLRARLGLDGFATVEEVLRKVDTLRSKLSASEAEVERMREALRTVDGLTDAIEGCPVFYDHVCDVCRGNMRLVRAALRSAKGEVQS